MVHVSSLNWSRIILCGFITGVVFTILTAVLVAAFGGEFLAATGVHSATSDGMTNTGRGLYLATVVGGLWAMWLYAVVRPWFGKAIGAVVTVSLAWWILASVQSLKWMLLLGIPLSASVPLAGNLVSTGIAVSVGAALFGAVQPGQALHTADT